MTKINKCDAFACFGSSSSRNLKISCELCSKCFHNKCAGVNNSIIKSIRDFPGTCWLCPFCRNPGNRATPTNETISLILQRTTSTMKLVGALMDTLQMFCRSYSQTGFMPSCSFSRNFRERNESETAFQDRIDDLQFNLSNFFESIIGDKRPRTSSLSRPSVTQPEKITKVDVPVSTTSSSCATVPIVSDGSCHDHLAHCSYANAQCNGLSVPASSVNDTATVDHTTIDGNAGFITANAAELLAASISQQPLPTVFAAPVNTADTAQVAAANINNIASVSVATSALPTATVVAAPAHENAATAPPATSITVNAQTAPPLPQAHTTRPNQAQPPLCHTISHASGCIPAVASNLPAVPSHINNNNSVISTSNATTNAFSTIEYSSAPAYSIAEVSTATSSYATTVISPGLPLPAQHNVRQANVQVISNVPYSGGIPPVNVNAFPQRITQQNAINRNILNSSEYYTVRQNTTLLVAPPALPISRQTDNGKWFYLTRFEPNESEENIINYIQYRTNCNRNTIKCHRLVGMNQNRNRPLSFVSFKLSVPVDFEQAITSPNFWPSGVTIAPFLERNPLINLPRFEIQNAQRKPYATRSPLSRMQDARYNSQLILSPRPPGGLGMTRQQFPRSPIMRTTKPIFYQPSEQMLSSLV